MNDIVSEINDGLSRGVNFNTAVETYVKHTNTCDSYNRVYTFTVHEGTPIVKADSYTATTDIISLNVAYSNDKYYLDIYPSPEIENYCLFGEANNKIIEMCRITREIDVTSH